ncbi:Uncharacterised protein [Mycobacteroides abscessus subsp. abscessus]|nr:Uncharacterised protein [Mycobacteroides abscessus subsp. abscessus]
MAAWIGGGSGSPQSSSQAMLGATRASCSAGRPIQKSRPSGSATSVRKNVPMLCPVMRRTSSPRM